MAQGQSMATDTLIRENEELRAKLAEAQEVLRAIHAGEVDALVVSSSEGDRVFTLKGAESAYRTLVETINEGAATVTADGAVLYCNQRLAEMLGIPHEQIVGRVAANLVTPLGEEILRAVFLQALAGTPGRAEVELRAAGGKRVPVYVSMRRLPDEEVAAVCLVVTDLTEQKQRDEMLAAGALAHSVLESAADAIAVCDQNGQILMANGAMKALCGFNPWFLSIDRVLPLTVPTDSGGEALFSVLEALNEGSFRLREVSFRHRDRRRLWLLLTLARLTGYPGLSGFVVSLTDVTERKQAEEALRQSEERLRLLGDHLPNSTVYQYTHQADGTPRFLYVSAGVERLNGVTAEDVLKDATALYGQLFPEERTALLEAERVSARDLTVFERQTQMRLPDGRIRWMHLLSRPRRLPDGQVIWDGVQTDITERRQVEEELSRHRNNLEQLVQERTAELTSANAYNRSLLEASIDPLVTIGPDGKITDINHATEVATGYERVDLIGTDFSDYFTEPDKAQAGYRQVFSQGFVRDYELQLRHRDGRLTSVLYNATIYRDESGKVVGVFAAARDITERTRARAALQAERQRFLDVLEALPAIITLLRPDHNVVWANRAYREALGDNVGRRCFESQFGRDKPCEECQAFIPLRTGKPQHWEWLLPNGRMFDIYNYPIVDADGSQLILEMDLDVTDVRQAQAALQELNQTLEQRVIARTNALQETTRRLQALMDAVPVGISFSDDATCQRITGNRAVLAQFAMGSTDNISASALEADAPGRQVGFFHDGRLLRDAELPLQRAVAENREIGPMELEIQLPNGRRWFCEASGAPVRDARGKVIAGLAVTVDITQRKQAEEALLRSEKLASVGRMAASVAHEINNPLAAVMNTIFLARSSEELPDSVRRYLEAADDELRRISHITRQTLGFYRERSTPAAVSVGSVLDSVVDLLRGKIHLKNAQIEKQYDGGLQVMGVPGELRQVFSNLVANSLDAIEEKGRIQLRVSQSSCAKTGQRRIRVSIADDGKGIDVATRFHIFEPLFTTKEATGSGLGLWVSKQLVEKHKGSIRVRSSTSGARRGTTFSILLPACPPTG
jgi:PAS domain S-box-containing protein